MSNIDSNQSAITRSYKFIKENYKHLRQLLIIEAGPDYSEQSVVNESNYYLITVNTNTFDRFIAKMSSSHS